MMRVAALLLVLATQVASAQDGFAPLLADGNGVTALARVTAVHVRAEPLGDALRRLTRAAGIDLSAPGSSTTLDRRVTLDADTLSLGAALLALIRGSGVELLVSAAGPTLIVRVVRGRDDALETVGREVIGAVRDSMGAPIMGVRVEVLDDSDHVIASGTSAADG